MRLLSSLVLLALTACSPVFNATRSGNMQQQVAEMQNQMAAMQQAQRDAETKCAELRNREVSWEEERVLGERLALGILEKHGKPATDDAIKYVAVVGRNLARYSSRPGIAWTFTVIDNAAPRSFSAPGGYVFITTGALEKMTNEAQLAGVLGHEIGNVTSKRTLAAYEQARQNQCTASLTSKALVDSGAAPVGMRSTAKYARNFERYDLGEADDEFTTFITDSTLQVLAFSDTSADYASDEIALRLMAFAGYDVREYETFLLSLGDDDSARAKLGNRSEKLKALREGDLAPIATGNAKPPLAR